jgi:hypothetical protein
MVAEPNPINRAVDYQLRGDYPGACLRMCVRGSDEHVVDPPAVTRLPDQSSISAAAMGLSPVQVWPGPSPATVQASWKCTLYPFSVFRRSGTRCLPPSGWR